MSIEAICECGRRANVPDSAAGRGFACKGCGESVTVPGRAPREAKRRKRVRQPADSAPDDEWLEKKLPPKKPKKSAPRKGRLKSPRTLELPSPGGSCGGSRFLRATILVLANIVSYLGLLIAVLGSIITMFIFMQGHLVPGLIIALATALTGGGSAMARGIGPFFGQANPNDNIGLRAIGIGLTILGVLFIPISALVLDALGIRPPA